MFDGTRRAYMLQILYVMNAIEELGSDKALEILEKSSERQGVIIARNMMKTLPEDMTSLETGAEVYRRFMSDAGAEIRVHNQAEKSVTFVINRCPFFEAFLDVGVDCGMFLNGLCTHLTLPSIQATLSQFNSKLKVEPVLTREAAEDLCFERVYLSD